MERVDGTRVKNSSEGSIFNRVAKSTPLCIVSPSLLHPNKSANKVKFTRPTFIRTIGKSESLNQRSFFSHIEPNVCLNREEGDACLEGVIN